MHQNGATETKALAWDWNYELLIIVSQFKRWHEPIENREAGSLSIDKIKELQKMSQEFQVQYSPEGVCESLLTIFQAHKDAQIKIKRERAEDESTFARKVGVPSQGDTQMEIDDDGEVREESTVNLAAREIVELD